MTPPARSRCGRALLLAPLLVVLALLGLLLVRPAGAATGTVTLTSSGPSPATITINRGDTVRFVNQDSGSHTITSNAGAWSFRATIPSEGSATTPPFGSTGQFGYSDAFSIAVVPRTVNGFISVRASSATTSPKPSASKSPNPRPSATRSATSGATASPSASASATSSGVAFVPGIGGLPSLTLGPGGPAPNVAPPETSSPPPTSIAYGPTSDIVQTSAHKYGLPVMLALLAAVGMLSLLVRLLLAEPARPSGDGGSRRTGEEASEAGE